METSTVSTGTDEPPEPPSPSLQDILVFIPLQSLGVFAILGNLSIIVVLLRNKYLHRASFILMLSLAIADVLHGVVTTCYFYPPIMLRRMHIPEIGIRIFNIVDWTAWAITLTHMAAICIDRLIAIGLYGKYNTIVTIPRIRKYTLACWVVFLTTNVAFFYTKVCCMIRPLESHGYYSFGYKEADASTFNYYVLVYTPVEIITIAVLTISNPITLYQLYKRHKRKVALRQHGSQKSGKNGSETSSSIIKMPRSQWQRASTMLLEMSMKMGTKQISTDVREMAARRANRQQQRILLQITAVALIFYAYMTVYYVSYYTRYFSSTAAIIFNSFCYSFTHMINPIIYFTLNKEMRAQLKMALADVYARITCKPRPIMRMDSRTVTSVKRRTDETHKISVSYSETSPLFSTAHIKSSSTLTHNRNEVTRTLSTGIESLEIRPMLNTIADEADTFLSQSVEDEESVVNKMPSRERSSFMNQLVKSLQYVSRTSLGVNHSLLPTRRIIPTEEGRSAITSSTTMQVIGMEQINDSIKRRYCSMTALETNPLLNVAHQLVQSSTSFIRSSSSSASSDTDADDLCDREVLLPFTNELEDSSEDESDVAFL